MTLSTLLFVYLVSGMVLGLCWRIAVLILATSLVVLIHTLIPHNSPLPLFLTMASAVGALQIGYLAGAALADHLGLGGDANFQKSKRSPYSVSLGLLLEAGRKRLAR